LQGIEVNYGLPGGGSFKPPHSLESFPGTSQEARGAGGTEGRGVKYFFPMQTQSGAWHVAYQNHRGEPISVMECRSFGNALQEAAAMTYRGMTGQTMRAAA
jgi:hypothetical protein